MIKKQLLDKIEKIQKFIEEKASVDNGRKLSDFNKLCFVQEDLTKLQEFIKKD